MEEEDSNQTERLQGPVARGQQVREIEGVFVVRDGIAHFVEVEVGITGQEYFEILSGVAAGDTVVSGPYQRIRALSDGDPVKLAEGSASPGAAGTEG